MLSLMSRMFTDARLKAQGPRTILPSPFSKYQRQPSMHVSQFPKAWEQLKGTEYTPWVRTLGV